MDDSQSSFISLSSDDCKCEDNSLMDTKSYEALVSSTKASLSRNNKAEAVKHSFPVFFTSIIANCDTCISQSTEWILIVLALKDTDFVKVSQYLEDSVCLLQMLSAYIKSVADTVSMSCNKVQTFPVTTGRIIKTVYSHCRDSESIYGDNLNIVERLLKDLFRSCHDLQLSYLMIMEKHFIFNLTEKDELDLFLSALDVNLEIGDIVQTLDVKTMAEQWKAFTVICEKHSRYIMDSQIYHKCSKVLCAMVENNINKALETEQEDKIVLRSLKISSFTIKILLKIHSIFQRTKNKNYEPIMELLTFVYLNTSAYLNLTGKSIQLVQAMNSNVLTPIQSLLKELLTDDQFNNYAFNIQIEEFEKDERQLGYIIFVLDAIRVSLQDNITLPKQNVIRSIFNLVPFGHIWFNIGLKFHQDTNGSDFQTYGLYEKVLTHTLALAASMNVHEMNMLEQKMYETVLGTDCMSSMFASNLWVLLSRLLPRFTQLTSLCKIYQKLNAIPLFRKSPQETQLNHLLGGLFETLHQEDQKQIFTMFSIRESQNQSLWCALKISNLPEDVRIDAEDFCAENVEIKFNKVLSTGSCEPDDIFDMINALKLVSTCTIDTTFQNDIANAWSRLCPEERNFMLCGNIHKESLWYFDFIEALVTVTKKVKNFTSFNLAKILHVISKIIEISNSEYKLLLIELICDIIISVHIVEEENLPFLQSTYVETFKNILYDNDNKVKSKFLSCVRRFSHNKFISNVLSQVIDEDFSLKQMWRFACGSSEEKLDFKEQLIETIDYNYSHKCIDRFEEEMSSGVSVTQKANSSNFDFDIDSLFDNTESEPACKKVKLNDESIAEIIARIETDTSLLYNTKENVSFQNKLRLKKVCEKLRNIID